jgi:UDP-N-acetylglucosamine 4-epimerase
LNPKYQDFRDGDVRHSQADISKAKEMLSYQPSHSLIDGINEIIPWYIRNLEGK